MLQHTHGVVRDCRDLMACVSIFKESWCTRMGVKSIWPSLSCLIVYQSEWWNDAPNIVAGDKMLNILILQL